ncbi:PucR family transcriptional regulator ligand-binding domain-containing protein [Streptomyces sp. B-S-A8]|uniref:PucR family transcriptional regulator ligand-binding domain-containing protein n=1 Tax=Streptomyces solicavernae TaxID=3043614 RepID=A0ABT6RTF8_9ACTN|nr:PucR family transcriptional regulator [Streptomyces sp. B-S-A8]MDI3387682.1 PucR family transcriptional regulator ligand-binding domain-containing protein [Streptomyces sp. B-S-A8]
MARGPSTASPPAEPGSAAVPPPAVLTVARALELPALSGARLVAGRDGARRAIRVANIMEVPDIIRWMRGGEFLLTTAYAVRDDERALTALVPELSGRGLAALGVKVGPYLPMLPAAMLRCADELGFPIVELPGEVMLNDILSEVIGTVLNRQALSLERSQALRDRLSQAVLHGGGHRDLVEALAAETGAAVAVRSADGSVLAAAGAPPEGTAASVTRPIAVGSRSGGEVALWAPAGRALDEEQVLAVEHVASLAAMLAVQERVLAERERRYRTLLLTELVSHPPRDRAESARRAAALGWDLARARAAVVVEVAGGAGAGDVRGQEERLLCAARTALGSPTPAWGTPGGLTLLVEPGRSLGVTCEALQRAVLAACPGRTVALAAGTVRDDFAELHLSHSEALSTLALGRELDGATGSFVRLHAEGGVYRLLDQLPTDELRALVDDALGPLLAYDAEHDGSLVHSLAAYLRRDRNGVETADELHIHYNTLRYRLKQIERLTGAPDKDPMRRLQTELAVHAHRLLSARAR